MPRHSIVLAVLSALTLAACGGEEQAAAPTSTPTPTRTSTPTATPSPTPTAKPALSRARSLKQCVQLWNEDALDDSFQVTANEFVADLAPIDVYVSYERGDCFVVMPIGGKRIAVLWAEDGRRPFHNPDRRRLKRGERFTENARADDTGRIELKS
ncbi:hypothetical protein OJ997_03565 [Solirubrobacter phytolaccae]|uniref:Lipoprotein n=1 Tax=Solirubrobacter phytolaccae TaxID=1404360 RepID=A0A9X3N6U1_9ACTN|nr:hypothetical protein [Solirubrobacter phytolaccae]MDA0179364.1 hypothetical protein [Solirubrobacter phytolaccae]